ncbi:transposase [Xenorhabdus sp. TS4]|nr:transposase [Xenorhabdus sp. TS4]
MEIPFLQQPVDVLLDTLSSELHQQWQVFNRELKQGQLKHLEYDKDTQKLHWRKPKADNRKPQEQIFYARLPFCDIADVLSFVNEQCHFLSVMKPLQPRYAKKQAETDSLMAVIIAQAMNHGNQVMARTSDIPYHILENTYQQYLRQATYRPPMTVSVMRLPHCRSFRIIRLILTSCTVRCGRWTEIRG